MAADYKIKYGTAAAITIGLEATPLASSATKVAGRESSVVDNTSNLYDDVLVAGKVTAGTSPTAAKSIEVWVYAVWHDGSNDVYPDVLDGTDSDETFTSVDIRNAAVRLAASVLTDNTTNRVYYFAPFSVAALFGGVMPRKWGLWVTHDTGVALNSTGSNHAFHYTGVHYQSV